MPLTAYRAWRVGTMDLYIPDLTPDTARWVKITGRGRVAHRTHDPRWAQDGDIAATLCGREQPVNDLAITVTNVSAVGTGACGKCWSAFSDITQGRNRHKPGCVICRAPAEIWGYAGGAYCHTHAAAPEARAWRARKRAAYAAGGASTPQVSWREFQTPVLESVAATVYQTIWPWTGPLHALCKVRPQVTRVVTINEYGQKADERHRAPQTDCDCGIYTALKPGPLVRADFVQGRLHTGFAVVGSVQIWGRVQAHQRGYRSEYAQITGLYDFGHPGAAPALEALSALYNAPLIDAKEEPWAAKASANPSATP